MTSTRKQREQPRVRLLWDELLSSLVAKALKVLEFRVTWIGSDDEGVPPRGSTDADIVAFARRTNQIIVTSNHDMMSICAEAGQRFVWLDPRGSQLSRQAQVLIVFQQIAEWEHLLSEHPDQCVVARRTGCRVVVADEAARLARNRMKQLKRRTRSARRHTESGAPLLEA